eukprot:7386786-Alexandrium_andersonii.AAC.1
MACRAARPANWPSASHCTSCQSPVLLREANGPRRPGLAKAATGNRNAENQEPGSCISHEPGHRGAGLWAGQRRASTWPAQ